MLHLEIKIFASYESSHQKLVNDTKTKNLCHKGQNVKKINYLVIVYFGNQVTQSYYEYLISLIL